MNQIKKHSGLLLLFLLLCVTLLCCRVPAAQADDMPWTGSGTEEDPWLISSSGDLNNLREKVNNGSRFTNKYFKLTNDIDLHWSEFSPIGTYVDYPFNGIFDGDNHTISGLYINLPNQDIVGFFGFTKGSCRILNLKISGNVTGKKNVGGIGGYLFGLISNCSFEGTVTCTSGRAGGIAGELIGQADRCVNYGNISGPNDVGGIAGYISSSDAIVGLCTNYGNVSAEGATAGGIVGIVDKDEDDEKTIGAGNINYGTISAQENVGGICGRINKDISGTNYGEIIGVWDVGDIYGYNLSQSFGTMTLKPNGAPESEIVKEKRAKEPIVPACPFEYEGKTFFGWNARETGGGKWYEIGSQLSDTADETLYAIWVTVQDTTYQKPDGSYDHADAIVVDTGFPYLYDGWYTVSGDTTISCTLIVKENANVNLILENTSSLFAYGIDVPEGSSLTIWEQGGEGAPGEMNLETDDGRAGIGSNAYSNCGTIVINGGVIHATGSDGSAGIGGGALGKGGSITINGGNITATGTSGGAGIGGGSDNPGGTIVINGGSVTATGGYCAAGIGGGSDHSGGTIVINGGTVTATGGKDCAGIGGGNGHSAESIIINDGAVTAYGGENGAGIGGGNSSSGGTITIVGGTVLAEGGASGAGIGGGKGGKGGTVTVNGGEITATGGNYGAGIGGGDEGSGGTVTINGGTVTANGHNGSAGIGGGDFGEGGTVVITGGSVTATGSVRSTTQQASAGIGAGRHKEGYYYFGGTCRIEGGTVLAISGSSDPELGAQAIGTDFFSVNAYSGAGGTLTFGKCMKVEPPYPGMDPVGPDERVAACREHMVRVSPCVDHRFGETGICQFCGVARAFPAFLQGEGTSASPYLISSSDDWDALSQLVNEYGLVTTGVEFKLTDDISVSTMVGTEDSPFRGVFDGGYKTLTLQYTAEEETCAPFRYIGGAYISRLTTAGTVITNAKQAAGIAGNVRSRNTIINCRVRATIDSRVSGDGTHGGFAACMADGAELTIEGCTFDGKILGTSTTLCGGFVGYARNLIRIRNCFFAPVQFEPTHSQNFTRYASGTQVELKNCYYLTGVNDQGIPAYSVSRAENGTFSMGIESCTAEYNASLLRAYPAGIMYNRRFYAGPGDTVLLSLKANQQPDLLPAGFRSSGGVFSRSGDLWSLTMPEENVIISAVYAPLFGDADFILPQDTAQIEEGAFENDTSLTAVDAGGCGILGAGAFRGCTGLTKIRLPKDCVFGEGVFDGCTSLTVLYGEAGGTSQEWAEAHGFLFADETPADPVIIIETGSSE